MTVVLHDQQLIFLKTRKSAGTSLEMWLSELAGPRDVLSRLDPQDEARRASLSRSTQNDLIDFRRYTARDWMRLLVRRRRARFYNHMPAAEVRRAVGPDVWSRYCKVTIERDPYERAVSMHRWKNVDNSDDIVQFLSRFRPEKLSNFDIYAIDGSVVADVVLDYAHLESDLELLAARLGITAREPLPVSKSRGRTSSADARELLGPLGCRLVEAACRRETDADLQRYRPGGAVTADGAVSGKGDT